NLLQRDRLTVAHIRSLDAGRARAYPVILELLDGLNSLEAASLEEKWAMDADVSAAGDPRIGIGLRAARRLQIEHGSSRRLDVPVDHCDGEVDVAGGAVIRYRHAGGPEVRRHQSQVDNIAEGDRGAAGVFAGPHE